MQIEDSQFEIFVVPIAEGVTSYSRPLPAAGSIPTQPANESAHLSWGPDVT